MLQIVSLYIYKEFLLECKFFAACYSTCRRNIFNHTSLLSINPRKYSEILSNHKPNYYAYLSIHNSNLKQNPILRNNILINACTVIYCDLICDNGYLFVMNGCNWVYQFLRIPYFYSRSFLFYKRHPSGHYY